MIKSPHKSPFRAVGGPRSRLKVALGIFSLVALAWILFTAWHLTTGHNTESIVQGDSERQHKAKVLTQRLRAREGDSTASASAMKAEEHFKGANGAELPRVPNLGDTEIHDIRTQSVEEQEGGKVLPVLSERKDGHISHYKGKLYDTHHENAPVKTYEHHDTHNYGGYITSYFKGEGTGGASDTGNYKDRGSATTVESGWGRVGMTTDTSLLSIHIPRAATKDNGNFDSLLRHSSSSGASSRTGDGPSGGQAEGREGKTEGDPIEVYHRALRTRSVCRKAPLPQPYARGQRLLHLLLPA